MKLIELNYGNVEVGKTAVETIEIWNESCKEQIYQAQRDPTTNPLDHVFYLRTYTWTLAAEEKFLCEICYRPIVVSPKNVDYFMITDTSGSCTKIIVRGTCIGPEIICSQMKMFMVCTRKSVQIKRRIKLINKSKVPATFMIDVDEKYQVFKVDTIHGIVASSSHKYITISFVPPADGKYTYQLAILILHQEPVIIELYGNSILNLSKKEDVTCLSYLWKENNGFEGYMKETVNTTGEIPPISLSNHYFNFGQVDVDVENVIQRIPQAVCFTNHSHLDLSVFWERDKDGIFNITPSEMQVRTNQSALFELTFKPNAKNNLFGRELVGSVFFQRQQSMFPILTFVKAIGQSFPSSSNGWIPQYHIPQTVIMPPCVPSVPVYATFQIKKFGHLPLMFQFVPPSASHFILKPMLGLIQQDYQIVVVEMIPEDKNEQIYLERWTVYFNGNTRNESYIDFKGYAEYANVVFCNNHVLSFPPVIPYCTQFAQLGMRNVTRHRITYRFFQLPPEFKMETETGVIDPNDTLFQECSFSPTQPDVACNFEVQCVLFVVKDDVIIGPKSCVGLSVFGRSELGYLKGIPDKLDFKEVENSDTKTLIFELVNFSSVNIYYKLMCVHHTSPVGDLEKDIKISPASETVFPGIRKKISVTITPRTSGYYEFAIQYLVRINFRSDEIVTIYEPRRICMVNFMCVLPTVTIKNLCVFGIKQIYSLNLSNPFLWKTLQINKLNMLFNSLKPGGREELNAKLFPMIVNNGILLLKIIFVNFSRFPISLALKRVKRCSCKPYKKKVGISLERLETDCAHQQLCLVWPTAATLKPNAEFVVNMKLQYTVVGKSNLCWDLDFGHDRHILFNLIMECLSPSSSQTYFLSDTEIIFDRVYIGNRQSVFKSCWLYNITNSDLSFYVNTDNMRKLNEKYHSELFSCLKTTGIVESRAATILIFKFEPRMFGMFKVMIEVSMGDQTMDLLLKGTACHNYKSIEIGKPMPPYCVCKSEIFPAYFSLDCIDIWSLPTYCHVTKMLLVYNNLPNDALAFEWKCQDIPGMISMNVRPTKGTMKPRAVQTFKLSIDTKGCTGRINFSIPCVFLNAGKRREYQRSIIKRTVLSKELEGQFTITEKGTFVPEPWIQILDKPEPFRKTLTFRCTIIPVEDECLKITLTDELKMFPLRTIDFDDHTKYDITKDEKEFSIATFILEGMLWDIVNSERFLQMLEDSLIPRRNLYYTQFTMDLATRRRFIQRSYISPPLRLISLLLESMLFILVHDEFSLKFTHLVYCEDIRHKHTFKVVPTKKQMNGDHVEEPARSNTIIKYDEGVIFNDSDDHYNNTENYDDLKTRFRVSFV